MFRKAGQSTNVAELICIPFAGGGRQCYQSWTPLLPTSVRTRTVELRGRERRFAEKPCETLECMLQDLMITVAPLGAATVLFGHSMGALVAFELARRLTLLGETGLQCLIVSGMAPPPDIKTDRKMYLAPDHELREWLIDLGGLGHASEWIDDIWDAMSPTIRADVAMVEEYRYTPGPQLVVPIVAYGSIDDGLTDDVLAPWADETDGPFESRCFSGGHFYFSQWPEVFASDLTGRLLRLVG